jgi:histone H4
MTDIAMTPDCILALMAGAKEHLTKNFQVTFPPPFFWPFVCLPLISQEKANQEWQEEFLVLQEQVLALKAPKLQEQVKALKEKVLLLSKAQTKGLGKGGAKRDRKVLKKQNEHFYRRCERPVLRENIQGITKRAIRRLARRGGVKRISDRIYEEARSVLEVFLVNVIRDALAIIELRRTRTMTAMDVVYALKRQGRTLYGFGV